jgi:hypothetical protein
MQADRQQFWRAFAAFAVKHVEGVAHVGKKIIAG